MYKYGNRSLQRLSTCNKVIQEVLEKAIKDSPCDITILCGHRSSDKQKELYAQGRTKPGKIVTWTLNSKHNSYPSNAIDIAPWVDGGIPWDDEELFNLLGIHIRFPHVIRTHLINFCSHPL